MMEAHYLIPDRRVSITIYIRICESMENKRIKYHEVI